MTGSDFGLEFHHFGLAAKKPDAAVKFLAALGYRTDASTFDPLQNVNLMMCHHSSMPAVEIIWPASDRGPVDSLLAKHTGGLVYHLCFTATSIAESLARMAEAGIQPFEIAPPKPAVLFGGANVSFYMIPGMGVIEIIEGHPT